MCDKAFGWWLVDKNGLRGACPMCNYLDEMLAPHIYGYTFNPSVVMDWIQDKDVLPERQYEISDYAKLTSNV